MLSIFCQMKKDCHGNTHKDTYTPLHKHLLHGCDEYILLIAKEMESKWKALLALLDTVSSPLRRPCPYQCSWQHTHRYTYKHIKLHNLVCVGVHKLSLLTAERFGFTHFHFLQGSVANSITQRWSRLKKNVISVFYTACSKKKVSRFFHNVIEKVFWFCKKCWEICIKLSWW